MRILVLRECNKFINLNEKVSSSDIENFKKYILGAVEYQKNLGGRNVKVVLKYEGTGSKLGEVEGTLIVDPIEDKDWIITSSSELDIGSLIRRTEADKWKSGEKSSLRYVITKLEYKPQSNATGVVDDRGIISILKGNEETYYTFSVESYG